MVPPARIRRRRVRSVEADGGCFGAPRSRFGASARAGQIVQGMTRPTHFEHYRYLGDKRTQVVYDLDLYGSDPDGRGRGRRAARVGEVRSRSRPTRSPRRATAATARTAPALDPGRRRRRRVVRPSAGSTRWPGRQDESRRHRRRGLHRLEPRRRPARAGRRGDGRRQLLDRPRRVPRERRRTRALRRSSNSTCSDDDRHGSPSVFEGADAVVHLAANADVRFGLEHPRRTSSRTSIATLQRARSDARRRRPAASSSPRPARSTARPR